MLQWYNGIFLLMSEGSIYCYCMYLKTLLQGYVASLALQQLQCSFSCTTSSGLLSSCLLLLVKICIDVVTELHTSVTCTVRELPLDFLLAFFLRQSELLHELYLVVYVHREYMTHCRVRSYNCNLYSSIIHLYHYIL